jgi:uncharacterized protein (DUF488 family)
MQQTIFTIGHSTHGQEQFIGLLSLHGITTLYDVRSKPYSRLNPQFNREELKAALAANGIGYCYLGKELGGRSDDAACYEHGKVQYDRLATTELFKCGLERVGSGVEQDFRIALMCAEKEPLECHRTILVARHLVALGLEVQHIHADGKLESHADALRRLERMLNLAEDNMFCFREELSAEAYHRQGKRIAYEAAESVPAVAPTSGAPLGENLHHHHATAHSDGVTLDQRRRPGRDDASE